MPSTIEKILARHPDEWVVLRLTESQGTERAAVLGHARMLDDLSDMIRTEELAGHTILVRYAGRLTPEGVTVVF